MRDALGILTLAAFALRSPSAYPEWSLLPDALLVTWAIACTVAVDRAPGLVRAPLAVGLAAVAASHLAAADEHASWSALAAWARLLLAFAGTAAMACMPGFVTRLSWTWAGLGVTATAHAAWQVFVSQPALLRSGLASAAIDARLADPRASSVFLLPAHLGAFLAAAAVLAAGLAISSRGSRRAASALGVAACLAGQGLAGSIGSALLLGAGLSVLALTCLAPRARRVLIVGAIIVAAAIAAASGWRRTRELARENPGSMRAMNWAAASRLIREAPVTGHGGGSFWLEYQRVKSIRANDARHAHQAYLEAAAEHGAVMLPLLAALVAALAAPIARALVPGGSSPLGPLQAGLAASAVAVLGHGLIDSGWSDPTWAVPAAALVGAWCGVAGIVLTTRNAGTGRDIVTAAVLAGAAFILLATSATGSVSAARRLAAREAGTRGAHREALALFLDAQRVDPLDPVAHAGAAAAALAGGSPDPGAAVAQARRAVELSPQRAAFHDLLGRALLADGRRLEAFTAAARAAQLAPHVAAHSELRDAIGSQLKPSP